MGLSEHATPPWLTGAVGLIMLTAAVVMMVIGAPSPAHLGDQVTLRTDSTMVRAGRLGPAAVSAWAEAYIPSMITASWSASSSQWSPGPPRARSAVS